MASHQRAGALQSLAPPKAPKAPVNFVSDRRPSASDLPDSPSAFILQLGFPVLLAVLVRLPGLCRPLLGHFATKNVTYAMIARNWVLGRASFWHPTMDCMAGGDRGWHLLEVPVSAYLAGAGWSIFGGSLDIWGRASCIAFSAGAVALMFALVRRWHGPIAACGASFALALSPSSVIFGQSFMLEAPLMFFALASFFCLERWLSSNRRRWLLLAATSFALLLLTKIYMLVLALPLAALSGAGLPRRPAPRECEPVRSSSLPGWRPWRRRRSGTPMSGRSPRQASRPRLTSFTPSAKARRCMAGLIRC